jgi:hypothetical protein
VADIGIKDPKAKDPIGTLDEIAQLNLDPEAYLTCSRGGKDSRGCPHYSYCELPYRGMLGPVGGPHNHAVLHVATNGGQDQMAMPCYHYMLLVDGHRQTNEVFEIIGDEGDEFHPKGTIEKVIPNPLGAGSRARIEVKQEIFTQIVERFPRPKDNPLLFEERYNVEVRARVQMALASRRMARVTGTPTESLRIGDLPLRPGAEHAQPLALTLEDVEMENAQLQGQLGAEALERARAAKEQEHADAMAKRAAARAAGPPDLKK